MNRLSLCHLSVPSLSAASAAELAGEVGFSGLGVCEELVDTEIEPLAEALAAAGVRASVCQTAVRSIFPFTGAFAGEPADPETRIAEVLRGVERLAPLRPDVFVLLPGPLPSELSSEEADERVVDCLRRVGDAAAAIGASVGFEPVHPNVSDLFGYVTTLRRAEELVEAAAHSEVGLLLDLWHLADDPDLRDIRPSTVERTVGIHVADREPGVDDWRHRAVPGAGELAVAETLERLHDLGYRGWMDAEVLMDDGRWGSAPPGRVIEPGKVSRELYAGMQMIHETTEV